MVHLIGFFILCIIYTAMNKTLAQIRSEHRIYEEGQEFLCLCGCGGSIDYKKHYRWYGMPDYINGHNPVVMSKEGRAKLSRERKGVPRTKEVCEVLSIKITEAMQDPAIRKKISDSKKGKPSYIRTEEHNRKMSEIKKVKNVWLAGTEEQKNILSNKMSKNMAKRTLSSNGEATQFGTFFKNCKRGYYFSSKNQKEIYYSSSYELKSYQILEQLSKVKSYDRCHYYLEYKFEDRIKNYIPDLLVVYTDGTKEIIEIKPQNLINNSKNQAKFKAAEDYCKSNNTIFSIWTEQELGL